MIGAVLLWICAVCVSTQAEYLGCYHSNVTSSWHGPFYDIDNCTEVCQFNFSSTLAAVQNGTQCFCGEGLLFQEEEACDVHVFAVCPIGRFNAPGTHNCDAACHCNGTCSYLGGACDKCMLGWIGDACEFRDCEFDNGGCEQQCVPQQKTAWCSCFDGYRSVDAGRCEDNDECASEPCEWRCTNKPGSYSCSCPAGYSLDSDRSSCLDENECETDELERCHLCVNIPGNYTCTCHHGYQLLNDMKTCEDLDECVDSDSCQHTCINSPGSFQCHCFDGYAKVSPSSCADIDECASDNGGCQHSCINYGGGYSCQCHHGYSLVGSKRCSDVDECVVSPCGQLCLNTIGGYECACDTGYLLTSDGTNCTPCAPGWFGVNCSRKCHCKDHRSCNIVNGTCPTVGCSAGFRGASCSEPFIAPHEESFHPATVALTVLIVMMLVAMALSGMILFLKYRGSSYAMPRMIIESRASFRNSHHSIIDTAMLRVKENKPIQININEMNRDSGDSKTSGMSLANDDDDKAALTKSVERIDISLLSLETCSEKYSSTFIPNEEFVHRGSSLWEDQLLIQEEFLNIPMKVHECYEVPKDLKKNRFKDIKPYKHNRVVLIDVEQNDPYGDYINASYIVGYALMDQFISAQGPRPNTVADFLCMLWEQGASCVVMLTREVEGGKRKCTNYWYKLHESKSYGIYTVEVIDEEKWLDFTIRKLKLQKAGSGSRIVTQFHFMSWPDYGCPEVSALLRLHKKVAVESRKGGVIVVHCSAGVGRSGTYIALNWLIHQSETEGGVDIPACVNRLRQSRVNMVQTVDQYAFLYRAMHQVLNLGETSAPIQSFSALSSQAQEFNITTGHTEIEKQYMFLEQHLHAPKVRTPSSPDKPPMSPLLPDSPDSLKAVYIDSIKCQDEYIAAEWPSAFTIDSFWKIVAHTKVQNVIVLQEDGWMPPVSLLDSPFVSINSTETLPDLFLHTISVERQTPEPDNHLTVKVIHLHKIPHTTGNRLPLNLVVSALRRMYDDKERRKSKCLVMCADGAFHTGQFLVITALMDMISLMNEADVFYVVGMMKAKNPEFVSSLAQYQHMYEVVDSICQQLSSTPPSFNVQ